MLCFAEHSLKSGKVAPRIQALRRKILAELQAVD
jgi:hypothetical protein